MTRRMMRAIPALVALAIGAASGRRSWGVGAGAGVAVSGYVLQALANNSERLGGLRRRSWGPGIGIAVVRLPPPPPRLGTRLKDFNLNLKVS